MAAAEARLANSALAHLFRLQSFLLNPTASWSSLLKPDILNILGLGLVAAAFCWSRATTRARQVAWLLAPAAVVLLMTPASRAWTWPELLRPSVPRLEAYVRPVAGMGVFSVFPWLAFVFVGAFVGSIIAESPSRGDGPRLQAGLATGGAATVLAGAVGAFLPSVTRSDFWTTSMSFFLIRVGTMTLGLSAAWLWLRWLDRERGRAASRLDWRSSPMLLFGRASLFVYWVHVELAYGFFSYPLHATLPLAWAVVAFFGLTAFMFLLAQRWTMRPRPLVPALLRVGAAP